jgi:chromosome condensin MukBEF ATPase and DNA-binding subunit MukB
VKQQEEMILQQYNRARSHLEKTLEREAQEQLDSNQIQLQEVQDKMAAYNEVVSGINSCLQAMLLDRYQLPLANLQEPIIEVEIIEEVEDGELVEVVEMI